MLGRCVGIDHLCAIAIVLRLCNTGPDYSIGAWHRHHWQGYAKVGSARVADPRALMYLVVVARRSRATTTRRIFRGGKASPNPTKGDFEMALLPAFVRKYSWYDCAYSQP